MKLLIVDDEDRNRRLLSVFVAAAGHTAMLARDGASALALAASGRPDLILLDLMMPDVDGFEVVRRLKNATPHRSIPIVIVSALDDAATLQRIQSCGADGYVKKPVDRWELTTVIERVLGKDAGGRDD